jgi:hypothetical protein
MPDALALLQKFAKGEPNHLDSETRLLRRRLAELETQRDLLCENLSKVYDYVSGGKVSKPFTDPQVVIQMYQQEVSELLNQVEDLQERVKELTPQDDEDTWYCPSCGAACSTDDIECSCGYEHEVIEHGTEQEAT